MIDPLCLGGVRPVVGRWCRPMGQLSGLPPQQVRRPVHEIEDHRELLVPIGGDQIKKRAGQRIKQRPDGREPLGPQSDDHSPSIFLIAQAMRKTLGLEPIDQTGDRRRGQSGVSGNLAGRQRAQPVENADGLLLGYAEPHSLRDGTVKHHRGIALRASGTGQGGDQLHARRHRSTGST